MKALLSLALLALPLSAAADDCRWSDGSFHGDEGGFQVKFAVNAACSEVSFQSSGNTGLQEQDTPETFALTEANHGWTADIHGVEATFANHGEFVDFIGKGINTRLHVRPVQ